MKLRFLFLFLLATSCATKPISQSQAPTPSYDLLKDIGQFSQYQLQMQKENCVVMTQDMEKVLQHSFQVENYKRKNKNFENDLKEQKRLWIEPVFQWRMSLREIASILYKQGLELQSDCYKNIHKIANLIQMFEEHMGQIAFYAEEAAGSQYLFMHSRKQLFTNPYIFTATVTSVSDLKNGDILVFQQKGQIHWTMIYKDDKGTARTVSLNEEGSWEILALRQGWLKRAIERASVLRLKDEGKSHSIAEKIYQDATKGHYLGKKMKKIQSSLLSYFDLHQENTISLLADPRFDLLTEWKNFSAVGAYSRLNPVTLGAVE